MKYKTLGELCDVVSGGTPARSKPEYWNNGTIPWIKIGNIKSKYVNTADEFITQSGLDGSSAKMLSRGTILYTIFATLGEVGILDIDACTNQAIAGITIKNTEDLLTDYLYYYLKSKKDYVNGVGRGVAQNNINMTILRGFQVPLPTPMEQRYIVSILDNVNAVIESREEELEKLDELIKARFVEMFGNPMINEKGFPLKRFGDLFELNAGGTPSKSHPEYWEDGTISWIGSNMCQNTFIFENDGNYITEEGFRHSSARMFPIDTVLVALVGATIGKTALLKFETTTNQNVLGIRGVRESGYTPEFVFYYTQGLYDKFLAIGDGGFAMASKGFISNLQIPVVALSDQKEFTLFANQVDKSKSVVQKSLDETQVLFDSLMQEYFG